MNTLSVGHYVNYKNNTYLIAEDRGSLALIISPKTKLQVSKAKLIATYLRPATKVTYLDHEYLVTGKGTIISLQTNKVMQWTKQHKERQEILTLAGISD